MDGDATTRTCFSSPGITAPHIVMGYRVNLGLGPPDISKLPLITGERPAGCGGQTKRHFLRGACLDSPVSGISLFCELSTSPFLWQPLPKQGRACYLCISTKVLASNWLARLRGRPHGCLFWSPGGLWWREAQEVCVE